MVPLVFDDFLGCGLLQQARSSRLHPRVIPHKTLKRSVPVGNKTRRY